MPKKDSEHTLSKQFEWPRHLLKLLGRVADQELARRAGVTLDTVIDERRRRGIPRATTYRPPIEWTDEMISLLGTMTDREVAAEFGIGLTTVHYKRRELEIPAYRANPKTRRYWTPQRDALLGTASDREIAKKLRTSRSRVRDRRDHLGITPFGPVATSAECPDPMPRPPIRWPKRVLLRLGKVPDAELAAELGVKVRTVARMRQKLGKFAWLYQRWTPEEEALVGKFPDAEVAGKIGRTRTAVSLRRLILGLPPVPAPSTSASKKKNLSRQGKVPDAELPAEPGIRSISVAKKLRMLGIRSPILRVWIPEEDALLGTLPDVEITKRTGRSRHSVACRRRRLGLPPVNAPSPRTK
ncbi:MAG: hypothetical protein GY856_04225 [bacterium]|nr:hypothetical protein [bacterium]